MDWMNALGDIVERYSGQGAGTAAAPANPHQDFQQVAQSAPQNVVASGLSQAFRSDQTPPFPEMLSNLFGQSNPNQRAGGIEPSDRSGRSSSPQCDPASRGSLRFAGRRPGHSGAGGSSDPQPGASTGEPSRTAESLCRRRGEQFLCATPAGRKSDWRAGAEHRAATHVEAVRRNQRLASSAGCARSKDSSRGQPGSDVGLRGRNWITSFQIPAGNVRRFMGLSKVEVLRKESLIVAAWPRAPRNGCRGTLDLRS